MAKKRSKDHLVRADSYDIDRHAQAMMELCLPQHWIAQKLTPDYALDYHVMIGTPTSRDVKGDTIYLQLKGVRKGAYRHNNSAIAYELEKKHLTFFSDEAKLPVFLLVVDLTQKGGYWLFMQEYLRSRKQEWKDLSSYTVHLPLSNSWDDHARWESEARRAMGYLRAGVSVQEVLRPKLQLLERLDPRFEIHPLITRDSEVYNVRAKEEVHLVHTLTAPAGEQDWLQSLLGRGEPIPLSKVQLKVEGSALFEHLAADATSIQFQVDTAATVTLSTQTTDWRSVRRLQTISGRITGGLKEHWFSSDGAGPVRSVTVGPLRDGAGGEFSCEGSTTDWEGYPILDLAGFDEAHAFFTSLQEHRRLLVEGRREGNLIFTLKLPGVDLDSFAMFLELLRQIKRARAIADHYGVNPVFTHAALEKDLASGYMDMLAAFIEYGEQHAPEGHRLKIEARIAKGECQANPLPVHNDTLKLRTDEVAAIPFLGGTVPVGRLEIEVSSGRVDLTEAEFRRRVEAAWELVEVPIVSAENATVIVRPMPPLSLPAPAANEDTSL